MLHVSAYNHVNMLMSVLMKQRKYDYEENASSDLLHLFVDRIDTIKVAFPFSWQCSCRVEKTETLSLTSVHSIVHS